MQLRVYQLPMYNWSLCKIWVLLLTVMPMLTGWLIMAILDLLTNTSGYDSTYGDDPLLYLYIPVCLDILKHVLIPCAFQSLIQALL